MSALVPTTVPRNAWTGLERTHVLAILATNWTQKTWSAVYVSDQSTERTKDSNLT